MAAVEQLSTLEVIAKFFQDGGFYMYPIALTLALGLAIAIERLVFLSGERRRNRQFWGQLQPVLSAGDFRKALDLAGQSGTALARMLGYGLGRVSSARNSEDVELALEEGLMEALPRLEKRTNYLPMLANVATLLGLLGTIIGLIQAFAVVSSAGAGEKAALLSSSIAVAMNTTAFGLIVAIPLLLLFSFLQSMTSEITDSMEMAAVRVSNILRQIQGERESAARSAKVSG